MSQGQRLRLLQAGWEHVWEVIHIHALDGTPAEQGLYGK